MVPRFLLGVLLIGTCAASAACSSGAQSSAVDVEANHSPLPAGTDIRRNTATDAIERADGDLSSAMRGDTNYRALEQRGDYAGMAIAFFARYDSDFHFETPLEELHVTRVSADRLGYHQVRLGQRYRGLQVLDAELIAHFDPDNRLYSVQGHYLPTPSEVVTPPSTRAENVRRSLVSEVGSDFEIHGGELVLLLPQDGNAARSAYRFEAKKGLLERREVVVDALTGRVVRNVPLVLNAR